MPHTKSNAKIHITTLTITQIIIVSDNYLIKCVYRINRKMRQYLKFNDYANVLTVIQMAVELICLFIRIANIVIRTAVVIILKARSIDFNTVTHTRLRKTSGLNLSPSLGATNELNDRDCFHSEACKKEKHIFTRILTLKLVLLMV